MKSVPYRWVIVATGAFMGCVAIGSIFSLPVILQPMSVATGWSRSGISLAMTLDFVTMGIASFDWGMMMDRFGPRPVLLAGSFLLGLGLVLVSRAATVAGVEQSRHSTVCGKPACRRFREVQTSG